MGKYLGEKAKLVSGAVPSERAAGSVNGSVVDRLGFQSAVVFLNTGAATGTPSAQGVALKVQTGDVADGSDMADVTGDTVAALTADNANAELNLNLAGYKRYLRVVVTTTFTGGTTPKIGSSVTVALGESNTIPV